tara:strand:- start:7569 stop:7997 length:429 start_codon:yes stop_codon:yes gene_type:complete
MIKSERNKNNILCYWDEVFNASKVKSPLEHIEQINLVAHCRRRWPKEFNLMLHVPNESNVPVQYRNKLSKCGLLPGASDWLILWPSNGKPYMVLELKRSRKRDSSVSKDQVDFLSNAEYVGAFACVAYGYKAALKSIEEYLK